MIIICMEYVKGDKVIVYLSTQDRKKRECDFKVCTVIACGVHDLMCETVGSFTKVFRVSKHRCTKLNQKIYDYGEHHPTPPAIGDLILSIRDTFKEARDEFTGIVEDIIYDPTSHNSPVYVIRTGPKTVRAYLENIIILESAN